MISYAHLGEALGPARGSGLDDLNGALQPFGKAVEIARAMVRQDPADRTARSDLANALYHAGDAMLVQPARARAALAALQESEREFSDLLKEDHDNERWRYTQMFVQRKIALALEALGRNAEAVRKLVEDEAMAQTFAGTMNAEGAQAAGALAALEVARIKTRAHDPSAGSLADAAARALTRVPIQLVTSYWGVATTYADMGNVFLELGRKIQAAVWLAKSAAECRGVKAPGRLEEERAANLAAVEKGLARAQQ